MLRATEVVAHGAHPVLGDHLNYGHAIKMARTARSFTQKQLAERLDVAASFVSLLESGKRKPSVDTLEQVCSALEVPMHLLVLMASSEKELQRVDEAEARALSSHLLRILTSSKSDEGA